MRIVIIIALVSMYVHAEPTASIQLDCEQYISEAVAHDPQVYELVHSVDSKKLKPAAIKKDAILPVFEISMAFGPSPGLRDEVNAYGDTIQAWDFSKMGPYFGTEIKVAQPLNFGQLLTGLEAARADIAQQESDIAGKIVQKSQEFRQYYYGYVLAFEFTKLAKEALDQLARAEKRLVELREAQELAEEEGEEYTGTKVSQDEILEIRASRFELDKAHADAKSGMQRALIAMRFSLKNSPKSNFTPVDTLLLQSSEIIPPLDTLKAWLYELHPDLKRLGHGLRAMEAQVRLAEAKLGPEFFVFGSFKYAKAWAGDRRILSNDALTPDPVNVLTGSFGIGLRYKLNFWSAREKARMSKTDLRNLQNLDLYAKTGLISKLEASYVEYEAHKFKMESAIKSLRATEALLKAQAMRYDVDPSESGKLVNAYRRHLSMQKEYYYSIYNYNIAVGDLLTKVGIVNIPVQRN